MRTMIWGSALLVAAVLSGCGGAEGFSQREDRITISGTVAVGRALAGGTVTARCVNGTGGRTKTESDGTYTLDIVGATLPCVLEATPSANRLNFYRSLLPGTGLRNGDFVAHISPLTELLVAMATGLEPGLFVSTYNSGIAPSEEAVSQAIDDLRELFAGRLDLSGLNPLTDELIAANPSTGLGGNAHDDKIEALMALLATAQAPLRLVASAIANSRGAFDPVYTVLAPAAASCSGLRSGRYRVVYLNETDPLRKDAVVEIDAVALTARAADGSVLALTADGSCRFTIAFAGETRTLMVSPSGMLAMHTQSTSSPARSAALVLPEQVLPVSELAGNWNEVHWGPSVGGPTPGLIATSGEAVVDSSGVVTASASCLGQADCVVNSRPFPSFIANTASGGFDISNGGTPLGRAFLFKNAAGKFVFVSVTDAGRLSVATRAQSVGALPGVFSRSNFRAFDLNGDGSLSAWADNAVAVNSVDVPTKTVTRTNTNGGITETIVYDAPRTGLRYRAANACTIADVATSCPELVQLPLQDTGVTVSVSVGTDPALAFFNIAVSTPTN